MVPFDFTEAAVNALNYAITLLGEDPNTDLLVLHVANNPVSGEREASLAEDFRKVLLGLEKRIEVTPRFLVASGNLLDTLMRNTVEHQIDLLIMGTMGDTEAEDALTNTSKLVLELNSPVLVVPFGCEIKRPKEMTLLMGNERIEQPSLLTILLEFARSFDARVHVLTVYKESILAEYGEEHPSEKILEYYLEHFFAEHHFKKGDDIEAGIMEYVEEKNIDLLSIIPRHHVVQSIPSSGRLTQLLTLHANIPVLVLD